MDKDYDLEGFFQDASEDFGAHNQSKSSHDNSGSRLVKLKKVKKCKKIKGHSKAKKSLVKPPTSVKTSLHVRSEEVRDNILDITPDQNYNQAADSKKPNDGELVNWMVKVKYELDSPEKTDKVILDLTNKHLVEDLEINTNETQTTSSSGPTTHNLPNKSSRKELNNNHTNETQTTSSGPPTDNLPNRSSRKELDSHRRLVEWTNKEMVVQVLSTWEEKASRYPEMRQEIIAGVTISSGELYFIVDWDGDRWKVKAEEAYRRIPMTCLKFYERLLVWDTK